MRLAAGRTPKLGPLDRRFLIVAAAVLAFLAVGGGGFFLFSNLTSGTGHGAPAGAPTLAPPSAATPTPTPTPTPTAVSAATPQPSALAGLSCTIAVSGTWASGSGGFLSFPGAQFKPDPSSAVRTPDGDFYGLTHVLALNRWVAVPRDWVTPDATR